MDHCASGKTQGFKCANCLWILQVQQKYKDKLLRDESYWDKVFGFPIAKSSVDSRKYPIPLSCNPLHHLPLVRFVWNIRKFPSDGASTLFYYCLGVLQRWHPEWRSCNLGNVGRSASAVDRAIVDCLLLDQEIKFSPRNWQLPEVLLRSTLSPAKSASQ